MLIATWTSSSLAKKDANLCTWNLNEHKNFSKVFFSTKLKQTKKNHSRLFGNSSKVKSELWKMHLGVFKIWF